MRIPTNVLKLRHRRDNNLRRVARQLDGIAPTAALPSIHSGRIRPCAGGAKLNSSYSLRDAPDPNRAGGRNARRGSKLLLTLAVAVAGAFSLMACVNDLTPSGRWSQPVEHEDFIYVGNKDGVVVRLDAATHQWDANWMYPFEFDDGIKRPRGGRAMYGAPTINDGIVYANNYTCTGNVCEASSFSVSIETGNLAWLTGDYEVRTKLVGRPLITSDGYAVFGTTAIDRERAPPGYLWALEASPDATGRFAFKVPLDGEVQGQVAYDSTRNAVYVGTDSGTLYAIDVSRDDSYADNEEARIRWSYAARGAITGHVHYSNSGIYFGDLTGRAYKIDPSAGSEDWTFDADSWIWSHPIVDTESARVYVGTLGGHVTALDDGGGQRIWDAQINGQIVGAPLLYTRSLAGLDQRVLAVPSGDQGVHVLSTIDGSDLGEIPTGAGVKSSPTLINDKLYVHNLDDELRWYDASNQSLLGCVNLGDGGRCE